MEGFMIQTQQSVYFPLVEASRLPDFCKMLLRLLGATFFLTVCAQIVIPLPFSPVQLSFQTFAVLMIGAMLGRKLGTAAVLLYLFEGAMGLPVFQAGGGGLLRLFGPTGGYLIGFLPTAYLSGLLLEQPANRKGIRLILSLGMANLVLYIFGLAQLYLHFGQKQVLVMGFYPFLIGDFLKVLLVSTYLSRVKSI
jgi:biotin transport system substrate-specific component